MARIQITVNRGCDRRPIECNEGDTVQVLIDTNVLEDNGVTTTINGQKAIGNTPLSNGDVVSQAPASGKLGN